MKKTRHYFWKLSPKEPFDFRIQIFQEPADYRMMDFHHSIHLNLLLSGGMAGKVGTALFELKPYDMQLTAPWELHGDNRIEKGSRLLSITADPDMLLGNLLDFRDRALSLFLLGPEERHRVLNTEKTRRLFRACGPSLSAITGAGPEIIKLRRWLAIQSLMAELLDRIPEEILPKTEFPLYQKLAGAFELLKEDRHVTIQEAAAGCSLSVSRFSHLFRQVCRISFAGYELRNRLNRAAILLRQGVPVKAAAEQEGFYDASHFSKHFRRQFGVPPGKFH